MRCILTNRTIGMTSFCIGTNPTIGTNGPSVSRIVSVGVQRIFTWCKSEFFLHKWLIERRIHMACVYFDLAILKLFAITISASSTSLCNFQRVSTLCESEIVLRGWLIESINQSINQSFILTRYVKELKNSFKIRTCINKIYNNYSYIILFNLKKKQLNKYIQIKNLVIKT